MRAGQRRRETSRDGSLTHLLSSSRDEVATQSRSGEEEGEERWHTIILSSSSRSLLSSSSFHGTDRERRALLAGGTSEGHFTRQGRATSVPGLWAGSENC